MRQRWIGWVGLLGLVGLVILSGCASSRAQGVGAAGLEEGIYDVAAGSPVSATALVDRLMEARYVVIAESHPERWHHEVQLQLWRALASRQPGVPVHLGMEMFQVPFGPHLADYVAGRIDEQAMLERTEYMERWRFDPSLYAGLWRGARQARVALLALNAPKELTRAISARGIEGLSPEQRAQLPESMALDDQAHRAWMREIFSQHGGMQMDEATFERFYQAQVTWDETMAQQAYGFMRERPAQERLVIVAGSGHVLNRYGIPGRLERRLEGSQDKVLTVIPITLEADEPWTREQLERYRRERFADFIWVRRSPPSDKAAPALPPSHPPIKAQ